MAEHAADRPWRHTGTTIRLDLEVTPNAKATQSGGTVLDAEGRPRIVLRVQARPVDGKANAAVIALLAKRLGCPRRALAVTAGQTARRKRVTWTDPPEDAEARLQRLAEEKK